MKYAFGYFFASYIIGIFSLALWLSYDREKRQPVASIQLPQFENITYDAPPNFNNFKDTKAKKEAFFAYFGPIIDDKNNRILAQRDIILTIKNKAQTQEEFNSDWINIVDTLSDVYDVEPKTDKHHQIDELLDKVNVVPRSLALAQAANESAWGTSRFATDGNNYFGQWCFKRGCGLVPQRRIENAQHEVRVFSSPEESVRAYIRNINTHPAYEELRIIRAQAQVEHVYPSGSLLAEGLHNYSERGGDYVEEIQKMIKINQLERSDPTHQIGTR